MYNSGENISRAALGQIERTKNDGNRIHTLKNLLSIQKFGEKDIEDPRNFSDTKRALNVIRTVWRPGSNTAARYSAYVD